MMNFNEVKSILESITELVKKAATLDLQEKIISSELPFIPKENLLPAISEARQNLTAV